MHAWLARYERMDWTAWRIFRIGRRVALTRWRPQSRCSCSRCGEPGHTGERGAWHSNRHARRAAGAKSAIYRSLVRAGIIDPLQRQRRSEKWKRWERGAPMELWQLDVVHGFLLADGTSAKALTGVDDHSRYCVSARPMARERTQPVCDGFTSALRSYGVP